MEELKDIIKKLKKVNYRRKYRKFKNSLKKNFSFFTIAKQNIYYEMVKKEKQKNKNYANKFKKDFEKFKKSKARVQFLEKENLKLRKQIKNMESEDNKNNYKLNKTLDENQKLKEKIADLEK